ncbi:MAG TPA: hypothetical protein VL068_07170 [Microthrixaceae bacterium]|nr:hypothetical protein [Microthrixaceae bacterium]
MNKTRGISLLVIVASLALFAGACSSDGDAESKKSNKTTTTEAKTKDGKDDKSPDSSPESSLPKLSNEEFSKQLAIVNKGVTDAGTNPCELVAALNTTPPLPTNPTQAEELLGTYTLLLQSVAKALPASSTANVKALNEGADELAKVGKAQEFSPDLFTSTEFGAVMSSEPVTSALAEFTELSSKCAPADGTETTTPAG